MPDALDASIVLQFALATVLPSVATALLLTLMRRTRLGETSFAVQQVVCGLVFGSVAIFGTEVGIPVRGAIMNVRDAAPLVAGLFFGGPAGIIAGFIGGVERWLAALWGRGMFTRLACSIATICAGCFAALLDRFLFRTQKPTFVLSLAIGTVAETLHLLLIFVTNVDDATHAFLIAETCTLPMVTCNALAVALSESVYSLISGERTNHAKRLPDISHIIQTGILAVVAIGFAVETLFTARLQYNISTRASESLLQTSLSDVREDMEDSLSVIVGNLVDDVTTNIPTLEAATPDTLAKASAQHSNAEISAVDKDGLVLASTNEELVGTQLTSDQLSESFRALLDGSSTTPYSVDTAPLSRSLEDATISVGASVKGGALRITCDAKDIVSNLRHQIAISVGNRHVGSNGSFAVLSAQQELIVTRKGLDPTRHDVDALVNALSAHEPDEVFELDYLGEPHYGLYEDVEEIRLVALMPRIEADLPRRLSVLVGTYMETVVFAAIYLAIYCLVDLVIVRDIWHINARLEQITNGNLAVEVDVRDTTEFALLSDGINRTVKALRSAHDAEAVRMEKEMRTAKAIQESALPLTFPPFPWIDRFDIYAAMYPAREVGGDFYDFFLIDDHTLGLLIADVSGKGIPASLFMMTAKTHLSTFMQSGMSLAQAVQSANWHLCQNNTADMFVTVWAATLDFQTGELTYVNAGHNPPLLRSDGIWRWLKERSGLFLGTFETAVYRSHTLMLQPKDELFLYTDGVNEAFSPTEEEYGNERLERFLMQHNDRHPRTLINEMRDELHAWANGAAQSDDVTMLAMEYDVPPEATGTLALDAQLENFDKVLNFVHEELAQRLCPIAVQNQIDIALEELFVNICNYAYGHQDKDDNKMWGKACIDFVFHTNPNAITISLTDWGDAFNPLAKADPKRPTTILETRIGGLGIFMVKRMMDDVAYQREDDKNIVAFHKTW